MTPKAKAFHLHFKFIRDVIADDKKAKQCALIAVELALEFCNGKDMNEEFDKVLYLVKVKNEIEKL